MLKQHQDGETALDTIQSTIGKLKAQVNDTSLAPTAVGAGDTEFDQPQPLSMSLLEQVQRGLIKQNTGPDGKVSDFDFTARDISLVPTTKAEMDYWYSSDGANWVAGVSNDDTPEFKEMVQAIRDRKITFTDARTVSDLNYHNKATFTGGEGGGSAGLSRTYNTNSSIFKDPNVGYFPLADGTLISWPKGASTK